MATNLLEIGQVGRIKRSRETCRRRRKTLHQEPDTERVEPLRHEVVDAVGRGPCVVRAQHTRDILVSKLSTSLVLYSQHHTHYPMRRYAAGEIDLIHTIVLEFCQSSRAASASSACRSGCRGGGGSGGGCCRRSRNTLVVVCVHTIPRSVTNTINI